MDTDKIYSDHKILAMKVRRHNKLEFQLAMFGATADPAISIQIEDLNKEIAEASQKLKIKPEGIYIDTSINLKDRRALLLQVAYDQSNVVLREFANCIQILFEFCNEKIKPQGDETIAAIKSKYDTQEDILWREGMALNAVFQENRLYFSKKADLAISGFVKKISRFMQVDWFAAEENLKDEIIGWDEYIDRAHRNIVDTARAFIESENKT